MVAAGFAAAEGRRIDFPAFFARLAQMLAAKKGAEEIK